MHYLLPSIHLEFLSLNLIIILNEYYFLIWIFIMIIYKLIKFFYYIKYIFVKIKFLLNLLKDHYPTSIIKLKYLFIYLRLKFFYFFIWIITA